jgi:LPXTG-motif cell wall-anchored protein
MKKLIILFGILFLVNSVYSETLKPVKIDGIVTVSLPASYSKKDTLGQQIFSANNSLGYMIAIREPNAKGNQPLKEEKDLNSVLKNYIKGIQSQTENGSAQNVRDTIIGTLKAKAFTLLTKDANGDNLYRSFILLYTKDATYTFEYGFPEARKDLVKDEAKAYFASIKVSPALHRSAQYINTSRSTGLGTNSIIEIISGALVISLVVWLIIRKRNRDNSEFA